MQADSNFIRSIRIRWVTAVAILLSILLADFIMVGQSLKRVQGSSVAMSSVVRLKTLTEWSAVVARYMIRSSEPEERNQVRNAMLQGTELMHRNYEQLLTSAKKNPDLQINQHLYEAPLKLQKRLSEFMLHFEGLARSAETNPKEAQEHYEFIMTALRNGQILEALELAEARYNEYTEWSLSRLSLLIEIMFVVNVSIILLIGMLIFRPMVRKVKEKTVHLETANRSLEEKARQMESSRRAALNIMEDAQEARWVSEKAQERLSLVIEAAPSAIFMLNLEGHIVLANKLSEHHFKRTRRQLLEVTLLDLLRPEDRQPMMLCLTDFANLPKAENPKSVQRMFEMEGVKPDGETFPIEVLLSLTHMEREVFVLVTINDLSERKKAENLRASEERFRGVIQQAVEALFLVDTSGAFAEVNDKASRMTGLDRKALLEMRFWDVFLDESEDTYRDMLERLLAVNSLTTESTILGRERERIPAEMHAGMIDLHGRAYLLIFARDITERKNAERDRREMSLALRNAVEGISRFNSDGLCTMFNQSFADMVGYSAAEITEKSAMNFFYGEDHHSLQQTLESMKSSGKSEGEVRALRKDGSVFNSQVVLVRTENEEGEYTGFYCFIKDVTEQKYKEALEIKSELISMVAHELRTPLHSVREGISVMLEGLTGEINPQQEDVLMTTKSSLDRLVRLVNGVLDFQRLEAGILEFSFQKCPVNFVFQESLKSCEHLMQSKGLQADIEEVSDDLAFRGDCDRIVQVMVNLINNAVKFTEKGGVTVRAKQKGDWVEISVQDSGIGIKAKDVPKLFRKFGQLESGKVLAPGGAGLGLVISKKIVEEHGGEMTLDSEFGVGSTFRFTLPIWKEGSEPRTRRDVYVKNDSNH